MLIKHISDLHSELWAANRIKETFAAIVPPAPNDKDVVLCITGDTGNAHHNAWLQILSVAAKRYRAVVCVEGNHFFYHNDVFGRLHQFKSSIDLPKNVFFLEDEAVEIDDVVFIGATLWTDFDKSDFHKMQVARRHVKDFECIRKSDGTKLNPQDLVHKFHLSKRYIFEAIAAAGDRRTVVMTHHGVSSGSLSERYRGDDLGCAFLSDLSGEILKGGPDLWLHAHVHESFDYLIGDRTRVVVNPYGRHSEVVNPAFNPDLLVDVGRVDWQGISVR